MLEETNAYQEHGPGDFERASQQFSGARYRKSEFLSQSCDSGALDHVVLLTKAVEHDVIPRLFPSTEVVAAPSQGLPEAGDIDPKEVSRFLGIVLNQGGRDEVSSFVEALITDGQSVERVCLTLLAPAARLAGAMWDDDLCTFFDVTLALGTLHRLMLALTVDRSLELGRADPTRCVLLVQAPGTTHTFGLQMVAEFFKHRGWSVDVSAASSHKMLAEEVRSERYAVVGFSVGCQADLGELTHLIQVVRRASLNPDVHVLVGGPAFIGHPEHVAAVGADGTGTDAICAVEAAERLVVHAA